MSENEKNMENAGEANIAIKQVIERLVTDESFKQQFMDNPESALKDYNLNEMQHMLLKTLDKDDLEKLNPENLEELFSADAAVYTPDAASGMEEYDFFEDDDEIK